MRPPGDQLAQALPEDATAGAWAIVLEAARHAGQHARGGRPVSPDDALVWCDDEGWRSVLPETDPRRAFLDLYLPICSATADRPITVGHLGQSLDGFIATHAGDSQYVTGEENILHLHRMRALSDAVVVGAGTVAADDPQLNTRLVPGPSPLRVVLDPTRRLGAGHRVFMDESAATLYVCGRSRLRDGETTFGRADILALDDSSGDLDVADLHRRLRERGCARIFIEGGGVTVSAFLEANLLDRLQMAIAPLLIGDGRPAIRLPPRAALRDCQRPRYRVFRMGGDVLFDCEVRASGARNDAGEPGVSRII
jgi:riboflavin-specific deaminase-like protein